MWLDFGQSRSLADNLAGSQSGLARVGGASLFLAMLWTVLCHAKHQWMAPKPFTACISLSSIDRRGLPGFWDSCSGCCGVSGHIERSAEEGTRDQRMMGLPLQARALSHQNRSPLLFSTGFCLNSHQTRNARMQSDAVQAKNTPTWDVLAKLQVSSTTAPSSLVSASFLCKRALSAECGYGKGGGLFGL